MNSKKSLFEYFKSLNFLKNDCVLDAFFEVNREYFLPIYLKEFAYTNFNLPIIKNEVLNQLSTTLKFIDSLDINPDDNILEIGTRSGYSIALISSIL